MTEETQDSESQSTVCYWLSELKKAGKRQEDWERQADAIDCRYRDKRETNSDIKKYNILWSNVETLKAAFYAQKPKPQVSRRHKDSNPLGRAAAMVLERSLEYCSDEYDFDDEIRSCVEDYLLPGRAVARAVYKPYFEKVEITAENGEIAGYEQQVAYEESYIDYVYWKDFRNGAARKWSKVPWVAFRHYMSKKTLLKRFGKEIAEDVQLNATASLESDKEDEHTTGKTAEVWEIWSKADKKVYWVADGYDKQILKEGPAPLDFRDFFPCPRPLFANKTNKNLVPIPDYHEYQDQAMELDTLTARINALVKALKVVGIYAADADAIKSMLGDDEENTLIPIPNWAMYAERGGIDGMVSWLPIDQVRNTVISLYEAREKTKQELYEITGLADIIRGASNAGETATAQRIKGQFASLRLQDRQKEVARFIRDLIRLKAEIISEHFSPQTITLMAGMQVPPQVFELLKNDSMRSFTIDIETDSTLQVDEQADKQSRVEFMNAASGFLERAIPAYQQVPQLGPLLSEMLMFGIRGFRAGRELEDAFEQAINDLAQARQNAPEQQTDPEAEAKAAKVQQDMQIDGAKAKQEFIQNNQQHALNMQKGQQDMEINQAKAVNDILKG